MSTAIDVAIIGAGPYGLSLAAHLRARRIEFRIFGIPMEAWKDNMPPRMLLKSYPWASSLSDPDAEFTVKQFCREEELPYHDSLTALPLERFIAYGTAFQERFVPNVEQKYLVALEPASHGLIATFEDGEVVNARHTVLAVGVQAFKYIPRVFGHLPSQALSHSGDYGPLDAFRGKDVTVVGAGASASDLAALLAEDGISVSLVARGSKLSFASQPRLPSLWDRLVEPSCGIGSGWILKLCSDAPWLIHMLGERERLKLAKLHGPLGGAFMKSRVIGKVPLFLGRAIESAPLVGNKVHLRLAAHDGTQQTLQTDHIISATGYKVDVSRLSFLDARLRSRIRCMEGTPILSGEYQSTVPGLYFVGPASAASFGPVGRFVFGATHPSRKLASHLARGPGRPSVKVPQNRPIVSTVTR